MRAFEAIETPAMPPRYPPYGAYPRLHPAEPDPHAAFAAIPVLDPPTKRRLLLLLDRLAEDVPPLYTTLPRQMAHRDFKGDNLLVVGDTVSAVLDFEFAGEDLRAVDVALGLLHLGREWVGYPGWWPLGAAFARGYTTTGVLTVEEAAAVPTLMRLRAAYAIAYFIGRCQAGTYAWDRPIPILARVVRILDWLETNEPALVALLQGCAAGRAPDVPRETGA